VDTLRVDTLLTPSSSDGIGPTPRLLKDYLAEREGFEGAAEKSIGKVVTDIAPGGRQ
jgi:hypothetical protein